MAAGATIVLLGATGLVGSEALRRLLADDRVEAVAAPTRRALPCHPKLLNPLIDFDAPPLTAEWWRADAAICALGTTRAAAGSPEAFRAIDHDLPLSLARILLFNGTKRFVLVSAVGADPGSSSLYLRTKGELERSLEGLKFDSLAIARPSFLLGSRTKVRGGELIAITALSIIGPLLPRRLRPTNAATVASALVVSALGTSVGRSSVALVEVASNDA
jgi:uncharacterized protein YbjT (DUF2867 family)